MNPRKSLLPQETGPRIVAIGPVLRNVLDVIEFFRSLQHQEFEKPSLWPIFALGRKMPAHVFADEVMSLVGSWGKDVPDFIRLAYDLPFRRRTRTLWCCRKVHPVLALFMSVCVGLDCDPNDLLRGWLCKVYVERLKALLKRLNELGPYSLQLAEVATPDAFNGVLELLPTESARMTVLCDWALDGRETAMVKRATAGKNTRVRWPQGTRPKRIIKGRPNLGVRENRPYFVSIGPAMCNVMDMMGFFYSRHASETRSWPALVFGRDLPPDAVEAEVSSFESLWGKEVLSFVRMAFDLPLSKGIPTIWCCRTFHPAVLLFVAVCQKLEIRPVDLIQAPMNESQWRRLKRLLGLCYNYADSPLKLAEVSTAQALSQVLEALAGEPAGTVVVCDWPLDAQEQALAERASVKKQIRVVWPEGLNK